MKEEHQIVTWVYLAKEDVQEADRLISAYMPYIRTETAKFLKHPLTEKDEDELSIAMIAFHEAIGGYSKTKGAFLNYAALVIRSRLIDYKRKEERHRNLISLDAPRGEEEDTSLSETLADSTQNQDEKLYCDATREEIQELSRKMEEFGVSLTDVAENCPRQKRTLNACHKVLSYARENSQLLEELLRTKRLPIAKLALGSRVEKKTLERHRKYLVALLLVYTNGYEIIRGHLKQIGKGDM